MKLRLIRQPSTSKSTHGELYVDGTFECYTLEDVVRPKKIMGETAIWPGVYKVVIDLSNRFKRLMLHILNVPAFEGIRIHAGNTDKDTRGCILVGKKYGPDTVTESKAALEALFAKVDKALKSGDTVTIEVV